MLVPSSVQGLAPSSYAWSRASTARESRCQGVSVTSCYRSHTGQGCSASSNARSRPSSHTWRTSRLGPFGRNRRVKPAVLDRWSARSANAITSVSGSARKLLQISQVWARSAGGRPPRARSGSAAAWRRSPTRCVRACVRRSPEQQADRQRCALGQPRSER